MAVDHVAGIRFGRRDREVEFRLVEGIDAIERLSLLDVVADLLEHLMPAPLSMGAPAMRARRFKLQAVDAGDRAVGGAAMSKVGVAEIGCGRSKGLARR